MASIIMDPNFDSSPSFASRGAYKHLTAPWMCYLVELPQDTFNPDMYKGEVVIDGKRCVVVAVERKAHIPPWRKGELIALAVHL